MVERMTELSAQYPRYGYRRIRIFLDRDGHVMSPGRAHRLWRTARYRQVKDQLQKGTVLTSCFVLPDIRQAIKPVR